MTTCLPAVLAAVLLAGCSTTPRGVSGRHAAFAGFEDFSQFAKTDGEVPGVVVLTSPVIKPGIVWDELVLSWNTAPGTGLKAEARAWSANRATKFYTLGLWSDDPARHPRASVPGQREADGDVKTDTLVLTRPARSAQIRLTLTPSDGAGKAEIKYAAVSFCNTRSRPASPAPHRAAWGKTLSVPELRQADYPGGASWCSPTSVAMVLAYWSDVLHRPELKRTVPQVAAAVYDPAYDGTGNWPFNTAFAGELPGLRACVARLNDLSELEDWVAVGVPPVLSVSSYLAGTRTRGPDPGHLIVCAGFTATGDLIVNDPGVSVRRNERARRVYPRAEVVRAWKKSRNTVYLIYPETLTPPRPARR